MKSYYEILGISNNADAVTIKKAYRELVKKYHPDIYKGEDRDTKFQEIQKAYDVLSDTTKRARYDQSSHQDYEQSEKYGSSGGFGGFNNYQDFTGFSGFNTYTKTTNFNEIPLFKRILLFIGLALMLIVIAIGFIVVSIIRVIIHIINEIFR